MGSQAIFGRLISVLLPATGALAIAISHACAQTNEAESHHVTASLVAETRTIVPGQPLRLALRQQIQPGWHTYWLNPGDSGLPTTIEWTLPQGFKAGPITWPTPKRIAYGPVVDYGYENETLLPVTIDVPSDLPLSADVVLSAHASWLACSDTCIPEDTELKITVPVASQLEPDPIWGEHLALNRSHLPLPNPFQTTAANSDGKIELHVATGDASRLRDLMFFPAEPNIINDDAPQTVTIDTKGLTLTLLKSGTKTAPALLNGVLVFHDSAAQADASPQAITISTPLDPASPNASDGLRFIWAAVLAFAGGILLNLMPCVLPILSVKAFGLVQHAQSTPREVRLQGIAYGAGVLMSFAVIAGVLIGFRAAGAEIGWGFQLQSPVFIAAMIYLLVAVGFNLSGLFSFGDRVAGAAGNLASRDRYAGSFLTGALATLIATPCTAPFMAAALGYAITQPWYRSLAIFEAVGLGLAFPYLAIAFSPGLRRFLPKPGVWMLYLKQFLAFPVYGTGVWLSFVLAQEAGELAVTVTLAGLVLIAFAAWLYEAVRSSERRGRQWGIGISAAAIFCALALLQLTSVDRPSLAAATPDGAGISWLPFDAGKIDELQAQGRPVFVDFTADWCITCKLNERVALSDQAVLKAFADGGVVALRADWTREDPAITRMLEANDRAGVPLYLFYPKARPNGERPQAIVLPQILTAETIIHDVQVE
ncbi:MAG: protein-disulfide reductase DsbD domain-containing protein [Xanthobacteraceae bacterium]|jgi:thiol:disulfide interchange protein